MDDIHLLEVDAGLYELPYIEASQALDAATKAEAAATAQYQVFDDLYHTTGLKQAWGGQLTPGGIGLGGTDGSREAEAQLAGIPYSTETDPHRMNLAANAARGLSEHRTRLEQASWAFNSQTAGISQAENAAKRITADKKSQYAYKDIAFRSSRAMVSRQLAYVQLMEHIRPNSILNYSERLSNVRSLFNISARQLISRVRCLIQPVSDLYGINSLPFENPPKGIAVDKIAEWLLKLQDEIGKIRKNQRVSIFTNWLSIRLPTGVARVQDAVKRGLDINIQPTDTDGIRGLLRGVAFEYTGTGSNGKPVTLTVTPAPKATGGLAGGGGPSTLIFGRVLPVASALDIRPQQADALWNGDPFGSWRVQGDLGDTAVEDIAMHLWLAYK